MTDEKFTELVNLYFDKEISAEGLKELKFEIAACPERKRAFAERCRLHKAMRMALRPQKSRRSRGSQTRSRSRRRASSISSRSKPRSSLSSTRISAHEEYARTANAAHFPRWMLASGLAASLAIGILLLPPVFRDTTDPRAQPALVGVSEKDLLEEDPLANLGKAELRRYAVQQQRREAKRHASLIAQMRLMGLRPELTPVNKELREVSLAAAHEPDQGVSQAELFQRIQSMKAIPEPRLLRCEQTADAAEPSWPGAFEPAQLSF